MKRELLLSTLILTSPIGHISAEAATHIRSQVLEQIQKGQKKILVGEIGKDKNGRDLFLKIETSREPNDLEMTEPNLVQPEFAGKISLVDGIGQTVATPYSEDGQIFDLIHSDDYSSKFMVYSCSSTSRCEAEGAMALEFVKGENSATLKLLRPSDVVGPADWIWVDLKVK